MTYIIYLILSIYIKGLFKEEQEQELNDSKFKEENYKKLYEFNTKKDAAASDSEEDETEGTQKDRKIKKQRTKVAEEQPEDKTD